MDRLQDEIFNCFVSGAKFGMLVAISVLAIDFLKNL